MSSKQLTIADLNNALKPFKELLDTLSTDIGRCAFQMTEVYGMVNSIASRIDLIDQKCNVVEFKTETKKFTRKSAKKLEEPTESVEPIEEDEEPNEPAESSKKPAKASTKSVVKKVTTKKSKTHTENETDEPLNEQDTLNLSEEDSTEKSPTPKKIIVKKPAARKTTKPKPPTKEVKINKMEYFYKMYDQDNTTFDIYLTPDVKANLARKNNWDEIQDENVLYTTQRQAYYKYMIKNHDDKLIAMKEEYLQNANTRPVELVDREED